MTTKNSANEHKSPCLHEKTADKAEDNILTTKCPGCESGCDADSPHRLGHNGTSYHPSCYMSDPCIMCGLKNNLHTTSCYFKEEDVGACLWCNQECSGGYCSP